MISYGEDYAYADNRLRNTLVSYKGYPFFIEAVMRDGTVVGQVVGTKQFTGETFHLNDFDLTPLPLGYVNKGDRAIYFERMPSRFYRQGLTRDTLYTKGQNRREGFMVNELACTIRGLYPKFEDCIDVVANNECLSWAFSRKFAIGKLKPSANKINVSYRGNIVGVVNDGGPKLDNKYSFLNESLEEVLHVR